VASIPTADSVRPAMPGPRPFAPAPPVFPVVKSHCVPFARPLVPPFPVFCRPSDLLSRVVIFPPPARLVSPAVLPVASLPTAVSVRPAMPIPFPRLTQCLSNDRQNSVLLSFFWSAFLWISLGFCFQLLSAFSCFFFQSGIRDLEVVQRIVYKKSSFVFCHLCYVSTYRRAKRVAAVLLFVLTPASCPLGLSSCFPHWHPNPRLTASDW